MHLIQQTTLCTVRRDSVDVLMSVGTFKESDGTGLGEGDTSTAKDVSAQIENEDQILGAQQRDQQQPEDDAKADAERGVGKEEGQEGVEMEQDFDGEIGDVSGDEREPEGDEDEVCSSDDACAVFMAFSWDKLAAHRARICT